MVATEDDTKRHQDVGVEDHSHGKEEVSESSTDVTTSTDHHNHNEKKQTVVDENGEAPAIQQLTVEELYDKDKYDLSTMEPGDVFVLLQ